ncbi:allantoate amidohydrolase [Pusillimonas sp. T7-7]|uniref:Zn-dependent hydrolase n=1 Tax=Pusillimonas sp. (strain T7-7) TaxID=1007105 RepID=UPI0002084D05|nr:Zn-dependent hydrolase [Pusillimonas sp. T7-7]AEC21737.1 allantoate amidohydrolase [Pusillimonas sp. T7-7]
MKEPTASPVKVAINADRLWRNIESLSSYTDPALPWTRRAFTPLHQQGREWLKEQMELAGLAVQVDAAGNLIGRRKGRNPDALPLVTGSHTDTVMAGGRFDGILGVLAGIEVAHSLQEHALELDHPLEVIDFMSEEPSDYGISCVGSRAMAGLLDASMLAARDHTGETLAEGLARIGAQASAIPGVQRDRNSTAAYLELHIEQGPVLEQKGLPIGVVTHIVGGRRMALTILGAAGHSGTTPMALRSDALVAASLVVAEAHRQATRLNGPDRYVVATVGRLLVEPNMANAIPGKVDLVLEVRSDSEAVLDSFPEDLLSMLDADIAALKVQVSMKELTRSHVTHCDPALMGAIESAASELGYSTMQLPSGAGHDGVYCSATGPIGMIFVPCLGGRSHCPEEWASPEAVGAGAQVLLHALLELDTSG